MSFVSLCPDLDSKIIEQKSLLVFLSEGLLQAHREIQRHKSGDVYSFCDCKFCQQARKIVEA